MASTLPLTGDASGKGAPIPITATTNGTAQVLHAVTNEAAMADDIWASVVNTGSTQAQLVVLENGSTEPANISRKYDVPPAGALPVRIYDGGRKTGGLVIKAYTSNGASGQLNIVDHWANRLQTE